MKKMTKLLMLLLALVLSFSLFACGGGNDDDGDEGGEPGDETVTANDLELITDGVANFRFVLGDKIPADIRTAIDFEILPALEDQGIEVESAQQGTSGDKVQDVEVLIGNVTNRGEDYIFDPYDLGKEGYMIKIVGTKVVIQAGSDTVLRDALMEFAEDILKIDGDSNNITMLAGLKSDKENKGNEVLYVPEYDVTSLSVGSTDMKGYTIAADSKNSYHRTVAANIQDVIYETTGYYFKIVKPEEASDKSIILKHIDKKTVSGKDTFTIKTDGTKLVISCAYDNKLEEKVSEFLSNYIIMAEGDVSFSGKIAEEDISVVYYEDFGAVANDKKNDYQAFYDAHVFANECGQTVTARTKNKDFILSDPTITLADGTTTITSIPIKTNVDWTDVKIIIDDTDLDYVIGKADAELTESEKAERKKTGTWVFYVQHDEGAVEWNSYNNKQHKEKLDALGKVGYSYNTEKLDLGLGYPAMLVVYNKEHEVYRRYGSTYSGAGSAQHEVIVIDKDGNIDESTPFMFDYEQVTNIIIYRIDIDPITIKGGTVTTLAPQMDAREYQLDENKNPVKDEKGNPIILGDAGYFARGLYISRSFTTIDGLKHYVENEITVQQYFEKHIQGAVYNGFYCASNANEVLIKNCVMTGRRYYHTHGTYEFSANCVNKIVLEDCYQHNFWVDSNGNPSDEYTGRTSMNGVSYNSLKAEDGGYSVQYCWGLGGTNFCKNMHYINSRLSRFDAHCGLLNGSIEGCEISFFEIIGKGTFKVIDTDYYSNGSQQLVYLRGDYGCTWEGDFIIDNVRCYVAPNKQFNVFLHSFVNWYFGYKCYIPSVEIKDIAIYDSTSYNEDTGEFKLFDSNYQYLYMYSKIGDKNMHLEQTSTGVKNDNPIGPPEFIKISSNKNGYKFNIPYYSESDSFFADTEFTSGTEKVEYKKGEQGWFKFY